MATHTNSGGSYGRKFQISRENGQSNKEGTPYFFEWIPQLPDDWKGSNRKFETRTNGEGKAHYYELFRALDGNLVGITTEEKTIQNRASMWLYLHVTDGGEDYRIECGEVDGRYSMDVMKRLLDPNFNPVEKIRFSPYAFIDKQTGKPKIGLSAMCGTDTKLSSGAYDSKFPSRAYNSNLEGMPQATSVVFKGETQWDFTPVSEWLLEQVRTKVIPRLIADPISTPAQTMVFPAGPAETAPEPPTEMDTLPF